MNILHWWREDEADYVQAIQSLKAEKPLPLPAIQPLKAKRVSSTQTVKIAIHLGTSTRRAW